MSVAESPVLVRLHLGGLVLVVDGVAATISALPRLGRLLDSNSILGHFFLAFRQSTSVELPLSKCHTSHPRHKSGWSSAAAAGGWSSRRPRCGCAGFLCALVDTVQKVITSGCYVCTRAVQIEPRKIICRIEKLREASDSKFLLAYWLISDQFCFTHYFGSKTVEQLLWSPLM